MQRGFPDGNGGRAIELLRLKDNVSPDCCANVAFLNVHPFLTRTDTFLALDSALVVEKLVYAVGVTLDVFDLIHQLETMFGCEVQLQTDERVFFFHGGLP